MLKSRIIISFYFALALIYSGLIFYISPRLPLWTNKWAAALTWVVYAQIVKALMVYLSMVLLFVLFIKWFYMRNRWRFLALCAVYIGILFCLVSHLGNSVNEYVHFPEYAACVLLWYTAFKHLERNKQKPWVGLSSFLIIRICTTSPLNKAITVGLLLGILEELYQFFLPQRVFDFYDILLNFMGVWLGGMLIWIFTDKKDPGIIRAPIVNYG